jgi:hypothetical protein
MRYFKIGVLIAFASALLVLPNAARLSAADSDEAKDRHEIEALMWRYARALDTFNADAYASCYTPDGQFGAGANPTKGADALKKMISDLKANREKREQGGEAQPPMYHMEMNTYVEFSAKDRARHHSYWQTVFGAVGRGGQVRVAAAGNAVDDLVKVNGKWLIKVRNVAPGASD